jgi:hypothetical protein
MPENYKAWWEGVGAGELLRKFIKYPTAVIRQIGVANDTHQAPLSSDQETFPTLSPGEANKLLMQEKMEGARRAYLAGLIESAKSGNAEALDHLNSIAGFGRNPSARKAMDEIDNSREV